MPEALEAARSMLQETRPLSTLRPCDVCNGAHHGVFWEIDVRLGFVETTALNQTLGLAQMLGGSLRLAEAFGPADAVMSAPSRRCRSGGSSRSSRSASAPAKRRGPSR